MLRGDLGMGKTALLRDAMSAATGLTVLSCAGVPAETELSFSGLHQLLTPLQLDTLPEEQATVLRRALGRESGTAPDLVVRSAVLELLRRAAEPLLLVVDDVQLLDTASAQVLAFVARRVSGLPVGVLLAADPAVDLALPELSIGGLPADAVREFLAAQGVLFDAATSALLTEATDGNPLAIAQFMKHRSPCDLVDTLIPVGWHRALATTGPDDDLAKQLEDGAGHRGIPETIPLLRHAARLSSSPSEQQRRGALAAQRAWKSGYVTLARALLEELPPPDEDAVPIAAGLRGLVELGTGDQSSIHHRLLRDADRTAPEQAAELLFMAVGAAFQANEIDGAIAAAQRVAELDLDPAYRRCGRLLAKAVSGDGDGPEPWHVFDSAPDAVRRSGAYRWIIPMAISWIGPHPVLAREFGMTAYADLIANGMQAIGMLVLPWLVDLEFRLGRWPEARSHAEDGLRVATDLGLQPKVADFQAQLALLAAVQGDDQAREHAAHALETAEPVRNRWAAAQAIRALGLRDLARGDYESAAERLSGTGMLHRHQHVASQAAADTVEAQLRTGDREQASQTAETLARASYRCQALLAEDDHADKLFQLALHTPGMESLPFERARTALLHGQWLRRQRRPAQASTPLRLAGELFDSLKATPWADRARAELRACGGRAAARREAAPALTAQELEVARLAATGLSNREIGARLLLSPRTVGYHLHKIFPKLGIVARAQLREVTLA